MNQSIIFNDDWLFDKSKEHWQVTGMLSGEIITIYFHSLELKTIDEISQCTKFDLEEMVELWLEHNEPENREIHITSK